MQPLVRIYSDLSANWFCENYQISWLCRNRSACVTYITLRKIVPDEALFISNAHGYTSNDGPRISHTLTTSDNSSSFLSHVYEIFKKKKKKKKASEPENPFIIRDVTIFLYFPGTSSEAARSISMLSQSGMPRL